MLLYVGFVDVRILTSEALWQVDGTKWNASSHHGLALHFVYQENTHSHPRAALLANGEKVSQAMHACRIRPIKMNPTKVEIDLVLPGDLGVITLSHRSPQGGNTSNANMYIHEMLSAGASVAARENVSKTLNEASNNPRLFGLPMSS